MQLLRIVASRSEKRWEEKGEIKIRTLVNMRKLKLVHMNMCIKSISGEKPKSIFKLKVVSTAIQIQIYIIYLIQNKRH